MNNSNYSLISYFDLKKLNDYEYANIQRIKIEIEKENYTMAINMCNKNLIKSKENSDLYILNIKILLIKALNLNEQYEDALVESEKFYINNSQILNKEIVLLKEFYYQRAYSYSGLHNQKYEIDYTKKALAVMQQYPLLFKDFDFISIYNDLYYYQNNYEDIDGMSDTFLQYLKFYNHKYNALSDDMKQYAVRVLRKMKVIEALNQNSTSQAEKILHEFLNEVSKPYLEDDLAYINSCYSSITDYYYFNKNYVQAIQIAQKYLMFAKQCGSKFDTMLAYSKLATASQQSGDFLNGLKYTNLSIESFEFGPFSASFHALNIIKAMCLAGLNRHSEAKLLAEKTVENILSHKLKKPSKIHDYNIDEIKELNSHNYINIFASAALLLLDKYKIDKLDDDILKAEKLLRTSSAMFKEFYLQGAYNPTLYNLHNKNAEGLLYIAIERYSTKPEKQKILVNLIEENASKHLFRSYQYKAGKELDTVMNQLEAQGLRDLINQVQTQIEENEDVLKYYVLENNTYLLHISKQSTKLVHISETKELKNEVLRYLDFIRKIDPNYQQLSKGLADRLLPIEAKNKVIVISDNFLNYIPFETLVTSPQNSFALANHQFSYAYSLSIFLWNQYTQKFKSNKKAIVFNPSYEKSARFGKFETPDLPYSQKEAKQISNEINAKLLAKEVRKEDFIANSKNHDLLHFSMHAVIDDDNYKKSCLLFSKNEPLYFEELYQMEIPADMVVLGACNTGYGTLKNGEGIMSLSLAFSFAGTRSTIYSLWEAPDAATAEILGFYYQELKKGVSKDLALANAKRYFLKKNPMMAHPYFWAGFIVNGDTSAIFEPANLSWYYLIGIFAITLLISHILFRRKKLV